jgi:hypothetical protein
MFLFALRNPRPTNQLSLTVEQQTTSSTKKRGNDWGSAEKNYPDQSQSTTSTELKTNKGRSRTTAGSVSSKEKNTCSNDSTSQRWEKTASF